MTTIYADNDSLLYQHQGNEDVNVESICRLYEIGRTKREDEDEDEDDGEEAEEDLASEFTLSNAR